MNFGLRISDWERELRISDFGLRIDESEFKPRAITRAWRTVAIFVASGRNCPVAPLLNMVLNPKSEIRNFFYV
jgi:hypothetical protein